MRTPLKFPLPFISPQRLPLVPETHDNQKLQHHRQQSPPKATHRKMYLRNLLDLGTLVIVALSAAIPAPGKGKSVFRSHKKPVERMSWTDIIADVLIKGNPEDVDLNQIGDLY